jgi:type IV secretion system protein VirB9
MFNMLKIGLMSVALLSASASFASTKPIALDSRIKTYIYSENEVFRLVVHYGYQTSIEFADGEEIQTISAGNSYAWQLTPIGRRLFIKPLEDNIMTNMTILTNKRSYHLEIQSKNQSMALDEELVYVVRFFYPDENFDSKKPDLISKERDPIPVVKPFNFDYTLTGSNKLAPVKIFDDGINTFFKFPDGLKGVPKFEAMIDGQYVEQTPKKRGEYILVNVIANEFKLTFGNNAVLVFNEAVNKKAN